MSTQSSTAASQNRDLPPSLDWFLDWLGRRSPVGQGKVVPDPNGNAEPMKLMHEFVMPGLESHARFCAALSSR